MTGRIRRTFEWIDRVGGKVYYRGIGLLVGLMAAACISAAWNLLTEPGRSGGERVAGLVFAVCAALLVWLALWCFSPKRRLSDIE